MSNKKSTTLNTGLSKIVAPDFSQRLLQVVKWVLLILVVGTFGIFFYPELVTYQPDYQLGDIAGHDIKAPRDFFVEDKPATDANRQLAVEKVLTVYDHDTRIATAISDRIIKAFALMAERIAEYDAAQQGSQLPGGEAGDQSMEPFPPPPDPALREKTILAHRKEFADALGIEVDQGAFKLLYSKSFSPELADHIVRILLDILANGVVANKEVLLKEAEKGIILRNVADQTEKTVYALRQYYGPDQAKTMVRIVAEPLVKNLNYNEINLIVDFCQNLLQPNITLNRNETEKRKTLALESITPIMNKVKAGEMILREGERVSSLQVLQLKEMNRLAESKPFSTAGIGAAIMVATLLVISYFLYFQQPRRRRLNNLKNLFFLSISLVAVFGMVKLGVSIKAALAPASTVFIPPNAVIFALPIAAAAMTVCLLLGFEIALVYGAVSAVCASFLSGGHFELLFFLLINQTLAAYWVQECRERKLMMVAGLKLGILNIFLALTISIFTGDHIGLNMLWSGALGFLGGIGSIIITVGLAPLVEMAFGYMTDITLLELANLDRPLLRRLMLEAPGTYHHSMIVGSMVEAAASEIGANPLLAKVSAYYHDIGKVKKPPYFIENQTGGRNKHDKLAPSMSSLILIAHVKDGVEIAQQHKLGKVIIDTIQQHHGTSLIHYFYDKAKQLRGEDAVNIDDFRYPGPKPQTKETGLVMLADVVEAASRTLENPTPARIQGLVQHLINKVFSDGQLDNCELTLKDLHSIAKSFNKILYGIHHYRIEYADSPTKEPREGSKAKNGHSDRQPTEKSSRRNHKNSKEGPKHLKRLGLS